MRRIAVFPILGLLGAAFAGCAKGPAGGIPNPTANRLTVNLTLQQAINPAFFYDFAFDDDGSPADGPDAFIGTTQAANGVVGGSFSVLVQYRGGQFLVFKRTDLGGGQEQLERFTNAFIGVPVASGNNIQFTLNLDATADNATNPPVAADFLFLRGVQQLDMNFVTTSEIIRDPNNLQNKPFDAFGPGVSQYFTFDVASTRTIRNTETVREPTNDVFTPFGSTITEAQRAQLDITDFTIDVRRTN